MTERQRNSKGVFLPSHGMSKNNHVYKVWCAMKRRCQSPNDKRYQRYGGRGIKVCHEWQDSFENFYEWAIGSGYKQGLTIDRIDNDKDYSPANCRWSTTAEQNRNYSRNHMITFNGKTQCVSDWADETGIGVSMLCQRIKNGWPIERLFDKRDGRTLRWKER